MNKITSGAPRPVDEDTEMSDASAPRKKTSTKVKLNFGKINGSSPTGSRAASPLPVRAGSVGGSRAGSPHVGNAATANKSMDHILLLFIFLALLIHYLAILLLSIQVWMYLGSAA